MCIRWRQFSDLLAEEAEYYHRVQQPTSAKEHIEANMLADKMEMFQTETKIIMMFSVAVLSTLNLHKLF